MADTLHFSLVSPARELFSGEVDQVDIPGTEGDLGVLPDHTPLMAAIRTGTMTVYSGGAETKYFVRGGFADVTPAGLTVLAESARLLSDVNASELEAEIANLEAGLDELTGEAALAARQDIDGLRETLASA